MSDTAYRIGEELSNWTARTGITRGGGVASVASVQPGMSVRSTCSLVEPAASPLPKHRLRLVTAPPRRRPQVAGHASPHARRRGRLQAARVLVRRHAGARQDLGAHLRREQRAPAKRVDKPEAGRVAPLKQQRRRGRIAASRLAEGEQQAARRPHLQARAHGARGAGVCNFFSSPLAAVASRLAPSSQRGLTNPSSASCTPASSLRGALEGRGGTRGSASAPTPTGGSAPPSPAASLAHQLCCPAYIESRPLGTHARPSVVSGDLASVAGHL